MLSNETYHLVIDKFLENLQNGTLKPNDKIYSEHQLARILNIPRAQVREVYAALSVLGVLYGQQGKGTFLSDGHMAQNTEILYLMSLVTAGNKFRDVLSVRCILETGTVRLAAQNRTEEQLKELYDCVNRMDENHDPARYTKADTDLHSAIAKASGNPLLHSLFQIVLGYMTQISSVHWTLILQMQQESWRQEYVAQHLALVHAIERQDEEEAERCIVTHFETLKQNYGLDNP